MLAGMQHINLLKQPYPVSFVSFAAFAVTVATTPSITAPFICQALRLPAYSSVPAPQVCAVWISPVFVGVDAHPFQPELCGRWSYPLWFLSTLPVPAWLVAWIGLSQSGLVWTGFVTGHSSWGLKWGLKRARSRLRPRTWWLQSENSAHQHPRSEKSKHIFLHPFLLVSLGSWHWIMWLMSCRLLPLKMLLWFLPSTALGYLLDHISWRKEFCTNGSLIFFFPLIPSMQLLGCGKAEPETNV